MKFVKQTRLHIPDKQNGNCYAAVIASFLDIECEEAIQIQERYDEGGWFDDLQHWLNVRGFRLRSADEFKCFHECFTGEYKKEMMHLHKDKYYLISGKSPRNNAISHICIYQNGKMVHDPHPDNTGIMTEDDFSIIESKL